MKPTWYIIFNPEYFDVCLKCLSVQHNHKGHRKCDSCGSGNVAQLSKEFALAALAPVLEKEKEVCK